MDDKKIYDTVDCMKLIKKKVSVYPKVDNTKGSFWRGIVYAENRYN